MPKESAIGGALTRYRIMAWIVGIMLLAVTAATLVKYLADDPVWIERVGPPHGFLYVVYLVTVIDLALRVRWSALKSIGVCLAGTIPFVSFIVEHKVTAEIKRSEARAGSAESGAAA